MSSLTSTGVFFDAENIPLRHLCLEQHNNQSGKQSIDKRHAKLTHWVAEADRTNDSPTRRNEIPKVQRSYPQKYTLNRLQINRPPSRGAEHALQPGGPCAEAGSSLLPSQNALDTRLHFGGAKEGHPRNYRLDFADVFLFEVEPDDDRLGGLVMQLLFDSLHKPVSRIFKRAE